MSSRFARRSIHWLAVAGTTVLTLVVIILASIQLPPVATWVTGRLIAIIPLNPGYELEVGRVSGDWLHRLVLEDVVLFRRDRELARVDQLRAEYDLRQLRGEETRLHQLTVDGARVVARRQGDSWDLANALRRSADTTKGSGGFRVERLQLRDVQLAAQLSPDSAVRVRGLSLQARDLVIGEKALLKVDQLNAAIAAPGSDTWFAVGTRGALRADEFRLEPLLIQTEVSRIAGRVVLPRNRHDPRLVDRLDIRLQATPLMLSDLASVVPAVPREGALRLEARAEGHRDGLVTAHLGARLDDALIELDGAAPLARDNANYRLAGRVRRLDPSRLYRAAPAASLNGTIGAKLRGPELARSSGWVELRLTSSRVAERPVTRLHLRANLHDGNAAVSLRGGLDQGTLTASGRVRPFDSIPQYRLSGAALGLPGTGAVARSLTGDTAEPVLELRYRISGAGLSPAEARLSGRVELAALQRDSDRTPLGHAAVALSNGRLDLRPELLVGGGTITAQAIARLGDTVAYEVRQGRIERVDLGQLTRDTSLAPVSGRFALSGRGLTPDAIVSARLALDEIEYGGRRVEQVTGQARLIGGRARLELRGSMAGGRAAIDADALPFRETKSFALRRASLERVDLGDFLGRPDLSGPLTLSASGTGRWRGQVRSMRGRIIVEPSRLGRIRVVAGSVEARLNRDRLSYRGSFRTKAGALTLAGEGRPFAEARSFAIQAGRLDSVDLGALLGRPDLTTRIDSRFNAAATLGAPGGTQARLALELLPSRVNWAQMGPGQMNFDLTGRTLHGDVRLEGRDAAIAAELTGRTGVAATELRTRGTFRLERLARWTGRSDAPGRLESSFDLNVAADSAGLLLLGGTINAIGGIGEVRLNTFHVALSPDSGAIHVDTLMIRSNIAALDGVGRVALRDSTRSDTLRVVGFTRDVAPLTALMSTDSVSLDSARLALRVTGPPRNWRVDGKIQATGVLSGSNLAGVLALDGGVTVDSTGIGGLAGRLRIENASFGAVRVPEVRAEARYDSVVALQTNIVLGDTVRIAAALQGVAAGDSVRAVLRRLDLTEGGRNWSLEQPAGLVFGPRLVVDGLGIHSGRHRVTLDGTLDRNGSSDIALRLTDVDLDVLREVSLSPIGGRLDGWLRLTGTAATPSLDGAIGLTLRSRKGSEIGRIRTDLGWTRRGLRVDATAAPMKGGRLTVSGTLPWRLNLASADSSAEAARLPAGADTVSLAVRADSFDLGLFEPLLPPDAARGLRGSLMADARVSGRLAAPRADGSLRASGFGVTVPTLDLTYRGGELVGELAGDVLRVEQFRLRTGKNELLTAHGAIRLMPLDNPALALTAELQQFRISHSETLQSIATGQLHLGGKLQEPTLTGRLTLGRTDITAGGGAGSATVEQVELTPEDLRQVARTFGPAALKRANQGLGLVERFRLDLNLRLPRQVWFHRARSPEVNVELSGRIRLRQEPGGPMQFFGRVTPVPNRGGLDVYGREFQLTGGEIILAGPVDSTRLDVTAQYVVPTQGGPDDEGVLIDVAAKGHLDSLSLEFSGDPEMSQDDMLSYIVTGRPSSDNPLAERAGGESPGAMGAEVALSGLTRSFSSAAEEQLGLDVFQIRQEGLHGLTLTAGRYVGSRVFLSMHLPIELGGEALQTPGTTLGPRFELEYALERWLRADVLGGNVPPRFTLRSRYAY